MPSVESAGPAVWEGLFDHAEFYGIAVDGCRESLLWVG